MELSGAEKYEVQRNGVVKILQRKDKWRCRNSAIQESLHSHEVIMEQILRWTAQSKTISTHKVIAEQICKSLQGKGKIKIVRFGLGASVEEILEKFEQFYGDQGVAVGDKRLS